MAQRPVMLTVCGYLHAGYSDGQDAYPVRSDVVEDLSAQTAIPGP